MSSLVFYFQGVLAQQLSAFVVASYSQLVGLERTQISNSSHVRVKDKRCDGMLTYANCLIFVELKERKGKNSGWVGEEKSN